MNPSIPPEFYESPFLDRSFFKEQGHKESWPTEPAGGYNLRMMPLQAQIVQQIMYHPEVLNSPSLPPKLQELFLSRFADTGRLSETNLMALGPAATSLDLSFPNPSLWTSACLNCLQGSLNITSLNLQGVPFTNFEMLENLMGCINLVELKIGPNLNFSEHELEQLKPIFERLSSFFIECEPSLALPIIKLLSPNLIEFELHVTSSANIPWEEIQKLINLDKLVITSKNAYMDEPVPIDTVEKCLLALPHLVILEIILPVEYLAHLITSKISNWPQLSYYASHYEHFDPEPFHKSNPELCSITGITDGIDARLTYKSIEYTLNDPETVFAMFQERNVHVAPDIIFQILRRQLHSPSSLSNTIKAIKHYDYLLPLPYHPSLIPLLAQILRLYCNQGNEKVFVAAINLILGLFREITAERLSTSDSKGQYLLQLLFENMHQPIESAIKSWPFPSDPSRQSPKHIETQIQILRFIGFIGGFPPKGRFPNRLCLSNSPEIVKYIVAPWHKCFLKESNPLIAYQTQILSQINNISKNNVLCHRLHEAGFADVLEEVLELWAPMDENTEFDTQDIPVARLSPMPEIMSNVLPNHLKFLMEQKPKLVCKIIWLLPFGNWYLPVCTWGSFHGRFATEDQPSIYCQQIKYIMKAHRWNMGILTDHLITFCSCFCKYCRKSFVEGHFNIKNSPYFIPDNSIDLMATQWHNPHALFSKPIAGWVLESKTQFIKWLALLVDHPLTPSLYKTMSPFEFMDAICDLSWQKATNGIASPEPYTLPAWQWIVVNEAFAILSHLPYVCDRILLNQQMPPYEWILKIAVDTGLCDQTSSLLYHLCCFRRDLVPSLAVYTHPVTREAGGKRRISQKGYIPFRLIEPLIEDSNSHQDALSLLAETYLAGLVDSAESGHVVFSRILAHMSFSHDQLHLRLQESESVKRICVHLFALAEDEGAALVPSLLVVEFFADYPPELFHTLPAPIKQALKKESIMANIMLGESAAQPWWECVEAFFIRSLFHRGIRLIANSDVHLKSSPSGDSTTSNLAGLEQDKSDIRLLVRALLRLGQLQDISTQEIAFDAMIVALTPKLTNDPELDRIKQFAQRVAFDTIIENKEILKERASFDHFGYTSFATEVEQRMIDLSAQFGVEY